MPFQRLGLILFYPDALGIQNTQMKSDSRMTSFGLLAIPLDSLALILVDTLALGISHSENKPSHRVP